MRFFIVIVAGNQKFWRTTRFCQEVFHWTTRKISSAKTPPPPEVKTPSLDQEGMFHFTVAKNCDLRLIGADLKATSINDPFMSPQGPLNSISNPLDIQDKAVYCMAAGS